MHDEEQVRREAARRNPGWYRRFTNWFRPLPDYLIIGAQKSGTTSLYSYVIAHPSVRRAHVKELHFFDREYSRGSGWYRAQFPLGGLDRRRWITGEATPYYLAHPLAPRRAAGLVPDTKILVVLRNPIDRAFSHYQHVSNRGHESRSFEMALEAEAESVAREEQRLSADPSYRSLLHERHSYRTRGLYADQLARWLEHYPRDQILVLSSEDMFRVPKVELAKVFSFLGLAAAEASDDFAMFKRGSYHGDMSVETRSRLVDFFRPHNRRLEEMLGMRFDWDA